MSDIWKVIVSRKSGGGKALEQWNETIKDLLDRKKIDYSVSITSRQYHAIELALESVKEGYRKFIAVGGDGAIHEILNGLCQQSEVPTSEITLAIIPVGSGNDWSRLYKIPQNKPIKAINAIVRNKVVMQDIGKVTSQAEDGTVLTRYMVNIGGVGFDAEVCRQFDIAKKRGKASDVQYLKSLMRSFFFYIAKRSTIKVDGEVIYEGPVFSLAFGVGKYCGGGMSQLPDADPQDGLLNITFYRRISKFKFITATPKLYNGSIYSLKEAFHTTCKSFEMTSSIPCPVEVDGENVGYNPVSVEVIPNAIRVITNK